MGGEQALILATLDKRIHATAIFYGPLLDNPARLRAIDGPVLGIFGNQDKNPSPHQVNSWFAAMKTAGHNDVTIYQYDGVGHAFASKSSAKTGAYNAAKAKEANAKMWEWLDAKLLK